MNLGMFSKSGDLKWLNVFQPSRTEVVDNKTSVATSFFLTTISLEGEKKKQKGSESRVYMLNTCADLFLKVESVLSTLGKRLPIMCACQSVCHLVSESSRGRVCP